ncbi:MAG: DUF4271 domain-containing protein [Bacteroidales bacterium]|nr:DUF4271 domain-containing protein [Bacteroidales bacterium]
MAKNNDTITTTAPGDSAAAVQPFTPAFPSGIPAAEGNDSVLARMADLPVMEAPEGSASLSHSRGPLYDTGSMSLLLLSMFCIVVCFKSGYMYLENFAHNLFSVRRRRENFFSHSHTMGDVRMQWALVFNTCVMQGLLLFYAVGLFVPSLWRGMLENVFLNVGLLTASCVGLHLFQHALYGVLGYVFGDKTSRRLWLSGFKASQAILGLLLFPVTAFLLLYPSAAELLLTIAAIIYIMVRIVFIFKGLRIFFNKFSQSLYFILYLCSVEIVPLVFFAILMVAMCTKLQS